MVRLLVGVLTLICFARQAARVITPLLLFKDASNANWLQQNFHVKFPFQQPPPHKQTGNITKRQGCVDFFFSKLWPASDTQLIKHTRKPLEKHQENLAWALFVQAYFPVA